MSTTITPISLHGETSAPRPPLHSPTRNRYFYGKLLDEHHLTLEQHYFLQQRRLLNRTGLGFGVLCGLAVTPADNGTSVIIHPGVAIDGLGREIIVPEPVCVDPTQIEDSPHLHVAPDGGDPADDGTLTICLCYHECDIEPVPALVSDCEVHERCVNGLIRERFRLHAHAGVPDAPAYPGIGHMLIYLLERAILFERQLAGDTSAGDSGTPALDNLEIARAMAMTGEHVRLPYGPSDPEDVGADPTTTELLLCCAPTDACVVLATVKPKTADNDMVIDELTYTRRIMSNDALQEMLIGLTLVMEKCCQSVKGGGTIDVTGDGQIGPASKELGEPIVAHVRDAQGKPVSGAEVTFTVDQGEGSFKPPKAKTKTAGSAASKWTLGADGPQSATVAVTDGPSATVTAKIQPGG